MESSSKTGMFIDECGKKEWYKNGKLHREDGPAIVEDWRKEWYIDGKLHRENDLPALLRIDYFDNSIDRSEWWVNGKLHRIGKPAIISYENSKDVERYYENGKLHNLYGPAIIEEDNNLEWYIDGIKYENREHWEQEIDKILGHSLQEK